VVAVLVAVVSCEVVTVVDADVVAVEVIEVVMVVDSQVPHNIGHMSLMATVLPFCVITSLQSGFSSQSTGSSTPLHSPLVVTVEVADEVGLVDMVVPVELAVDEADVVAVLDSVEDAEVVALDVTEEVAVLDAELVAVDVTEVVTVLVPVEVCVATQAVQ
jgi:hypothetical protein